MDRYRVLLADDHALIREGVKSILESEPDLEIVGEVGDGLELLEFLKESLPDLVILDISMPHLDGFQALKEIKTAYPEVKVLILTMHNSAGQLLLAFSSGADGYLLKGNVSNDLFDAIGVIREGGHFISNLMSKQIVGLFCGKPGGPQAKTDLNQTEISILQLICQGETGKQIAERLSISPATVNNHRSSLKKKLNIESTAGLIKFALEKGLASAADS